MLMENIRWKKFKIEEVLGNSNNSKAYHSEKLKFIVNDEEGIPYVTRTNLKVLLCLLALQVYFLLFRF